MKRLALTLALLWGLALPLFGQDGDGSSPSNTQVAGASYIPMNPFDTLDVFTANFGYANIGGEGYVGFRIQPEVSVWKFGVGLDVPLLFSAEDGSFRTEEYENGVGWLRLVRYLRFGQKGRDDFYARVGDLTGSYVGYGMLVNNYTNAVGYERRKFGLETEFLIGKTFGIEAMYSDFDPASLNLLAVRPFVRPLGRSSIPILKTLEIGGTYVTDRDQTVQHDRVYGDGFGESNGAEVEQYRYTEPGMSAWGGDVGLTVVNTSFFRLETFAQYARLMENDSLKADVEGSDLSYEAGDGFSVGAAARFRIIANVLTLNARLERLWYSDHFIPQFFSTEYEINKDARIGSLATAERLTGTFGSLGATILGQVNVSGGLLLPDEVSATAPAMVQVYATAPDLFNKVVINGEYYKGALDDLGEAFTLDDRSQARLRLAYKIKPYLLAGVDYRWTFAKNENGEFRATEHVMPYVGFFVPFDL